MKYLLPLLLLLLLPGIAVAHAWQVDAAQSTLGFKGSFQEDAFQGHFKKFAPVITYDPTDLSAAHFDVRIQLGSVDTQSPERDQTLRSDAFFDTSRFPVAHFVTQSFTRDADGRVVAHGTLSLHGIKHPVDLGVIFTPEGDGATLDVSTDLARLDYKLGAGNDWDGISKSIEVHGHLVLQ